MDKRQEVAEKVGQLYLALQFKIIRLQRGFSRRKLAQLAKVPVSVIRKCEDSKADIGHLHLPTLQKIAHALGVQLKVTFESFDSLPDTLRDMLRPERLRRPTFEEEFPALAGRGSPPPPNR
ncbi:MAG: helix-turn-helix transcriptional regulator [Candidatus Doudnabacteria bacterium]|nr:helix-turn-helix transcriptional regulator [Candidatus Doudnabacteria bacterium]